MMVELRERQTCTNYSIFVSDFRLFPFPLLLKVLVSYLRTLEVEANKNIATPMGLCLSAPSLCFDGTGTMVGI